MQMNGDCQNSWILWMMTYGIAYMIAGWMDEGLGAGADVRAMSMMVYTATLTAWCNRRSMLVDQHKRGLRANAMEMLPLAIPVLINLACSGGEIPLQMGVIPSACAAICEEIFFRAFLLRRLSGRGEMFAVVASSAVFAGFHLINMMRLPVGYVWMQAVYAFAVGMAYGAYAIRHGSLLACMISHAAINLTGAASTELSGGAVLGCVAGGLICALYAWRTVSASKKKNLEEVT